MATTDPAPGLFQGAAAYYARYRSRVPAGVVDLLVERFGFGGATHVLDLGCGTGQLAIPLAARGIPLHAVDPDVEMLAEGLRAERASGVRGVAWRAGGDGCLDRLHLPPLALCTMGDSFHWMRRGEALAALDRLVLPSGGVAVIGVSSGSVWADAGCGWAAVARRVVTDFLGPRRRAGGSAYRPLADRHEAALARSPFARVKRREFTLPEERTAEGVVGLQLSTSYASPALLGLKLDEFRRVLTERLLESEPSGVFRCTVTIEVLIATR